jgi:hypothetical protein
MNSIIHWIQMNFYTNLDGPIIYADFTFSIDLTSKYGEGEEMHKNDNRR